MSLRTRVALLVGITVLIASAIGGLGTSISSRNVGRDRLDQVLLADASSFETEAPRLAAQLQFVFEARRANCESDEALSEPPEQRGPGRRLRFLPDFANTSQVVRPNGNTIAACQDLPIDATEMSIAESGQGSSFRTATIEGERFRMLTQGYGDIGAVQFARSLEITENALRGLLVRTVGFGLVGAALAAALGWVFATRATKPVKTLSATAERIAQTQDLGERLDVEGDTEISALATSFNLMLSSLDTSRGQQQQLVQDASHELRTPLTSMRTNVDLLQRHADVDPEIRQQVLADIGAELAELSELTAELVESATEVPAHVQASEAVDLVDIANECADRARRRHRRDINVHVRNDTGSIVAGDVGLLGRSVTNLINNAVKFSDDTTSIDIEIAGTSLLVLDRGPGIDPQDLPRIFDRFYRATSARTAPGSGLGLAIVKHVVEGHGGSVHAANRTDGGAEIGFDLPALPGEPPVSA